VPWTSYAHTHKHLRYFLIWRRTFLVIVEIRAEQTAVATSETQAQT
jgi:hypothetical protein